ncbi:MAG TPA: DUF2249 domain-containing protein [Candidatus Desulfobacillus sp.]|nr:DUF2249 domain-containing protein [Candidatus Desulfobacillus sp.]
MANAPGQAEALDVRVFIPIERHKMLLQMFKDLPVGDSFVFINDHDPLPLYYEFRSIHGDVVGWEYLQRGGVDWKVRVTRNEASRGREFTDISTLMDLRKIEDQDLNYVVFHRYGMMEEGHTMEIIAAQDPRAIREKLDEKLAGQFDWVVKKSEPGEYVVHITKKAKGGSLAAGARVVKDFDIRPYPPAQRHDMVFQTFDALQPGEAFIFTNDHDPKPLYYQIEAESRQPFTWEYLESGSEAWKVKVAKTRE